jgi:hypothetical protein
MTCQSALESEEEKRKRVHISAADLNAAALRSLGSVGIAKELIFSEKVATMQITGQRWAIFPTISHIRV